jgi:peptidoglycan hydrolase-like protein with peptidoglycan-binding domain
MNSLRDYINLINEADGVTTTQLTPDQYQAKMAQVNAMRQQQGQAALPVTPSNQIATPTASQATPTTTPAPAAPAAAPAAKQWQAGVLGIGSSGPEVSALQTKLGIKADGQYGPGTQQAVMALQKKLGVTQDGAYGPLTRAAHEKGQGGRPKDGTNQAEKGQPGYTTGKTADQVDTKAAKGAANAAARSATTTDPGRTSLNANVTTAIPTVATPAGNPSGVGKNQTLTKAEIKNAEDALKDPNVGMADKAYFAGLLGVPVPKQKTAPNVGAPAPVQAAPAPVQAAPANNVGPRPVTGSPASRQWAAKYAKTHDPATGNPLQEGMSRSDKILLDKMLTIAGLR